jgi:hypothetical protein
MHFPCSDQTSSVLPREACAFACPISMAVILQRPISMAVILQRDFPPRRRCRRRASGPRGAARRPDPNQGGVKREGNNRDLREGGLPGRRTQAPSCRGGCGGAWSRRGGRGGGARSPTEEVGVGEAVIGGRRGTTAYIYLGLGLVSNFRQIKVRN